MWSQAVHFLGVVLNSMNFQAVGSVMTAFMAVATAWMAMSSWRLASITRKQTDFDSGVARVRLLVDILALFEDKVVGRATKYEWASRDQGLPAPYVGPVGPNVIGNEPFHHPKFRLNDAISRRVDRQVNVREGCILSATDVVNGLEQFAAAVEAGLAAQVWNDEVLGMIGRPTLKTFIEIVNSYFDVICWYRAESLTLYSATVGLYKRWESEMVKDAVENLEHLSGPIHDMCPVFSGYRIGRDRDFEEFLQTYRSGQKRERKGQVIRHREEIRWNWENEPVFVWVQAVNDAGRGIAGYPVTVEVCNGKISTVLAGMRSDSSAWSGRFAGLCGATFFGNSAGTVIFEVVPLDGEGMQRCVGEALVKVTNPLGGDGA